MSDWLHSLPIVWMALVVFGFTFLLAAVLFAGISAAGGMEAPAADSADADGVAAPQPRAHANRAAVGRRLDAVAHGVLDQGLQE